MTMKRTGESWMPADDYGRLLPAFTANLIVSNLETSLAFYRQVLGAAVHYSDPDFAALRLNGVEFMLHADHAYDRHPWFPRLARGEPRGLGAELRMSGLDPDGIESRARAAGAAVLLPAHDDRKNTRRLFRSSPRRAPGEPRGLGAELRMSGLDPDGIESRARAAGAAVLLPAQ